jgi:group I intron endonuclease
MPHIYALFDKSDPEALRYVGQTVLPLKTRLWYHTAETRNPSRRSWKINWMVSIGIDNVGVVELEEVTDPLNLDEREKYWISRLRDEGHRLTNATEGGRDGHAVGPKHSDEQKRKWSETRKGSITGPLNPNWQKFGPDHHSYGKKLPEETKKRLSELKKGKRNPNFGRIYTEEERRQRSEALKGRPRPDNRKNAHTRYHTNKGISKPETCIYCRDAV